MKQLIILLLFFTIGIISCAPSSNEAPSPEIAASDSIKTTPQFPEDWLGKYEGKLALIHSEKGKHTELPMTIIISKTDTANRWRWYSKALYNGKEIIKDYALIRHDSMPKNHYYMDENNGILLDRVLLDNAFYDYFEVGGTGLYGITRKVGDDIHFEIASFALASKTYSTYQGSEFEVDTVTSFKVNNTQKVLLKRVE